MSTVFVVTEANEHVATGHLMECIVCTEELIRQGYAVSFWINDTADASLKGRIPCQFHEYRQSIETDFMPLVREVLSSRPEVILFNLREANNAFLKKIRESVASTMICIDEFGHRDLQADIIINPMIDPYYWDYGKSKAELFCGADYLILSKKLETFHRKEKAIHGQIDQIVITMGGVDPRNFTMDLIEIVRQQYPNTVINAILGGGNRRCDEIRKKASGYKKVIISENVVNLLEMIYEADLVFCAGGNTLHEAACIGTPAIVLPSMPHERRTATCFEKNGFGLTVDTETDWMNEILILCDKIAFLETRREMSVRGKRLSDGMGWKRVVEIIKSIK